MKKIMLAVAGAALLTIAPGNAAELGRRPVYKAPQPAMVADVASGPRENPYWHHCKNITE
jgi:hypothetical protein